ncbi:hypothetical protein [Chlamydiifrater volucris]|uniref:hypothetical protein n=1 Tax=Chlamydiifrater volucris TaxID=2681470 RepID=UPI001BCDC503|nr:hypothetical protein [Chlamydiifrater volucris]
MHKLLFFRLAACCLFSAILMYSYVNKQNEITKVRLAIPRTSADLRELEEENVSLSFIIERYESSENLMEIASLPEYEGLHYPTIDSLVFLDAG